MAERRTAGCSAPRSSAATAGQAHRRRALALRSQLTADELAHDDLGVRTAVLTGVGPRAVGVPRAGRTPRALRHVSRPLTPAAPARTSERMGPARGHRGPRLDLDSRKERPMPIATPETYAAMLDKAKAGSFAYPAINCTSLADDRTPRCAASPRPSPTASCRSPGPARSSPPGRGSRTWHGAVALAEFAHVVAEKYGVDDRAHTDHCPLESSTASCVRSVDVSLERVRRGGRRCSSRTCGTARPCELEPQPRHRGRAAGQVPRPRTSPWSL